MIFFNTFAYRRPCQHEPRLMLDGQNNSSLIAFDKATRFPLFKMTTTFLSEWLESVTAARQFASMLQPPDLHSFDKGIFLETKRMYNFRLVP
jgi:hypothetical protein